MIGDKQALLKEIMSKIADTVTVAQSVKISAAISEALDKYEISTVPEQAPDTSGYLQAFLDAKRIHGRTESTIERYRYVIDRMQKDIGLPAPAITVHHLRSHLMRCKDAGCRDSTIEGMRCIYNSFFTWLQREGLIAINPCGNIGTIKTPKISRLPFSDTDIEKMKEACTSDRDRAMIAFLLSTGCRIGEVCALNRDDVDLQTLECRVWGKGNKERKVYIDTVTAMLLKRYLRSRSDACPALFAGRGTNRLQKDGARVALQRIAEAAGVEGCHPHRFRRTTATRLIKHGMPIQDVARILGHENINTTMRYIHIDDTTIRHEYRKYA